MDILAGIFSDSLQLTALVFLGVYFLLAYAGLKRSAGPLPSLSRIAPGVLTSIGIFFTFLGILIALYHFDVRDIDAAIPKFLSGLKLAFISSILGLGLSIVFRWIQALSTPKGSSAEVGAAELYQELQKLNENTKLVRDALVGDSDTSLYTQFAKLRNDFRDFADKMQEDGTKSLVQALEEVIKDFNQKITEQFGDNFKQLNEAVAALLQWQQEYKAQVEKLTAAFARTQLGIEHIEVSVSKIPPHMDSIKTVINTTQQQVEQLDSGLGSLSRMREGAEQLIPELRKIIENINTVQEKIDRSVEENVDAMNQSLKKLDQGAQQYLKTILDKMGNNLVSITEKFVQTYEGNAQQIVELTDRISRRR